MKSLDDFKTNGELDPVLIMIVVLEAFARMISDRAFVERVERQYRESILSRETGFDWYQDHDTQA